MTKLEIGSTVLAGTDVIEYSKIRKYPTITNLYYLLDDIKQIDVLGIFLSVST
jgi:hypothetical protein